MKNSGSFSSQRGFTLVEIMIVVAIIGLLASIAVPSFIRARQRSQATNILEEARQLDGAKDQYAIDNNKSGAITPTWNDLTPYIKLGTRLQQNGGLDSGGNSFSISTINNYIRVNATSKTTFSDATGGDAFWGPYS